MQCGEEVPTSSPHCSMLHCGEEVPTSSPHCSMLHCGEEVPTSSPHCSMLHCGEEVTTSSPHCSMCSVVKSPLGDHTHMLHCPPVPTSSPHSQCCTGGQCSTVSVTTLTVLHCRTVQHCECGTTLTVGHWPDHFLPACQCGVRSEDWQTVQHVSVVKKWGLADSAACECGEEVGTGGQCSM